MDDDGSGLGARPAPAGLSWRRVAWRAVPLASVCLLVGVLLGVMPWVSQFPQPLGRHLTEWFLRGLIVGYAALLATAVSGAVGLPWYVLRGRRAGVRRPVAARLWLACMSSLVAIAGVEAGAAIWLSWAHRMPNLPTRFPASPPGESSIAIIGGSSACGYPYHPHLSMSQLVAWAMGEALPGRRFLTDIRASPGVTLEMTHRALEGLERRPDVIIIYAGHNEIQSRFEASRGVTFREGPSDPILDRVYRLSLSSAFCRLIYETVSKERMGGPPSRLDRHQLIDVPACTPSEYAAILDDFHRRIESVVAYCERIGAVPVLVIPPANEGGFEPNRSLLAATVPQAERDRVTREFEASRAREPADPEAALAGYRAILARHPGFAEAHFRVGRVLERLGRYDEANRHYIEARDHDGYSVRCQSPFQEAYRTVARRHGCILVDGPAVLRRITPHGILEEHAIHDAHHPSLVGHVALAQAVLDALCERKALGWPGGPSPTIDPAEAVDHFGIDAGKWAYAAYLSANAFIGYTLIRYDPTERYAKGKRLKEACQRLAQGEPPESIGIPGFGVPPWPSGRLPRKGGPAPGPTTGF